MKLVQVGVVVFRGAGGVLVGVKVGGCHVGGAAGHWGFGGELRWVTAAVFKSGGGMVWESE